MLFAQIQFLLLSSASYTRLSTELDSQTISTTNVRTAASFLPLRFCLQNCKTAFITAGFGVQEEDDETTLEAEMDQLALLNSQEDIVNRINDSKIDYDLFVHLIYHLVQSNGATVLVPFLSSYYQVQLKSNDSLNF